MFELNEETKWILGRPNFACAQTAQTLRALGHDIPEKSEEEQAAAIYWMLTMYEKYGDDWREKGQQELLDALARKLVDRLEKEESQAEPG